MKTLKILIGLWLIILLIFAFISCTKEVEPLPVNKYPMPSQIEWENDIHNEANWDYVNQCAIVNNITFEEVTQQLFNDDFLNLPQEQWEIKYN